ncbi:MAG: hypothetical protein HZC02_04620, partial [Candidatus Levybacteria bacterium]|nr:hypothetical protein [Candidatus Levybacteria bacterium]
MSGFEKIDLDLKSNTVPTEENMPRKSSRKFNFKNKKKAIIITAAIVLLLLVGVVLPVVSVAKSVKSTFLQAKLLSLAIKQQ